MAATKTAYFEPQYLALRDRLLTALIAGEKPEMTANQWSPITVGRLGAAVGVAEARARRRQGAHRGRSIPTALRSLMLQLVLLAAALALDVRRHDRRSPAASSSRCTTCATPC